MTYPLAHDENGIPLDVPATATGWLVRRHGGGKGRPGAVYDEDGRPLVLSLDATAADLRGFGCKAGRYRLEAVDAARKPLAILAFTELTSRCGDGDDDGTPSTGSDAVAALARAVEAMQRVQAERERAQAQMFMRLIDRLSPVKPAPAPDLRETIGQVVDLQRALREAARATEPAPSQEESENESESARWWEAPPIAMVAETLAPLLNRLVLKSVGLSDDQVAEYVGATANAENAGARADAEAEPASPQRGDAPFTQADVEAKLDAVFTEIGDRAEDARALMRKLPASTLDMAITRLMYMETSEAAAFIREKLSQLPASRHGAPGDVRP